MIIFFKLLSYFPLTLLHGIGALFGVLTWLCSPTYRRHMQQNIDLALGVQAAKKLRLAAMSEIGKAALELPKIWMRPLPEVVAHVHAIHAWHIVEAARARGKGIIFLTPHLGCFEICAQYLSAHFPITVLYRPPKMAWLDALIKIGRVREQMRIAPADASGVRSLLKALKRGEAIGLLPDQAPRAGEGRWLSFFGRPAYTMTLAARLCETEAALVFVLAERLPYGRGFTLHFSAPPQKLDGTLEERAQHINHAIEALILQYPSQYLWGYNRYKRPRGAEAPPA